MFGSVSCWCATGIISGASDNGKQNKRQRLKNHNLTVAHLLTMTAGFDKRTDAMVAGSDAARDLGKPFPVRGMDYLRGLFANLSRLFPANNMPMTGQTILFSAD